MFMAVAVLPLAVIALRQPWGNRMKSAQEDQAANDSPAHPPDAVN
jgi:hypothetical protein